VDAIPAAELRRIVEAAIVRHLDADEYMRLQEIRRHERETPAGE
jgi:hypothetical protein